jgi:hypothetical protein
MGRTSPTLVPDLVAALKDKDPQVRAGAARALRGIGPAAKTAVPALMGSLRKEKDEESKLEMISALGKMGAAAKEAVPVLMDLLREREETVREVAITALGEIGPEASAAVPALIKIAEGEEPEEQEAAVAALGKIGPAAKAAVEVLVKAFRTASPEAAAEALAGIGREARAAIPELRAIVRNAEAPPDVREAAAQTIMKLDPELGAREGIETAWLPVRLGKVPRVTLQPGKPLSPEKQKEIRGLIAQLAEVKDPDFGLSGTLSGHGFAPLPHQGHWEMGLLTDHRLQSSAALARLVALGPDALPFLLEALDNATPTKLKINCRGALAVLHGMGVGGNPLNRREWRALSAPPSPKEEDEDVEEDDPDPWKAMDILKDFGKKPASGHYTVKVGDVCFVAIGQIVGRHYQAVRYQPTAIIVINSPVENRDMRERVRAVWSGKDPAKRLLDSLLVDYATEGLFNGSSLDGWDEGSERQIEAALRLLYYFPREAAPLVAARLRSLDVRSPEGQDGHMLREVKNGVRTADFIKAVAWCKAPAIREALAELARRTDDPEIKEVLLPRAK